MTAVFAPVHPLAGRYVLLWFMCLSLHTKTIEHMGHKMCLSEFSYIADILFNRNYLSRSSILVRVSSGHNGVGSTILYACENVFQFIGGSSTNVLTCPDTAQRTGINSSCQMKSVFVILRFPYDLKLYKYIPSCNLNLTQSNTKPRCSFVTLRMIT